MSAFTPLASGPRKPEDTLAGREAEVAELQSGIMAFLFTDIEGSTRLWEATPELMSPTLSRHDAIVRETISAHGGHVFKTIGDAFCAVFATPVEAVAAATAAQRSLSHESWSVTPPLRVRMAVHAGPAECRNGDYFGPALNRVARLLGTAHGEQIVVSQAAAELLRHRLDDTIALRPLGEFALKDLQQPERISQVVAPGLRESFPPLQTPERLLRNLPIPARPLLGRDDDARRALAMLGLATTSDESAGEDQRPGPSTWLVTLTGPGGTGKTRLALHLAREVGVRLSDGAVFVPLAAVTDPALVPLAIVTAFDLTESGGVPAHDVVLDVLRDRDLLLVLDNFEQIMDGAAFVAEILETCPRVRILVTSRERLGLLGEQEFPLPPLALPEADDEPSESGMRRPLSVAAISRSPAVQLFVSHARSVRPDLEVTEENAAAIAEICARLDGLPLAIELAAARAKLLSPDALLARFDRRLDVLSKGARDLPDRQRTMRDTIAWSYDLLEPEEQRLFADLAVFVGGATLETVFAVAGEDEAPLDAFDGLELVESLADKSLLRIIERDDEQRLLMFETIRDYARERLDIEGNAQAIGERHARYFLRLAEEAEPLLAKAEQTDWMRRIEAEQANIRGGISWFRQHGHSATALQLTSALWRFWWLRGDMSEGRNLLESLLREAPEADASIRAKALNAAGILADSQGDWMAAQHLHEEGLRLSRDAGDARGVAWALNNLGVVATNQGLFDLARSYLEENLLVAEQSGDLASVATALLDLGRLAHFQGMHDQAAALYSRSIDLFRNVGDESHVARVLNNLGSIALARGDFALARTQLQESLALLRTLGDRQGVASTLNNLGEVLTEQGDHERALHLYIESHLLAIEVGNRLHAAISMENLATLTLRVGAIEDAWSRYREAFALYASVADEQGMVYTLAGLTLSSQGVEQQRLAATLLGFLATPREGDEQFTIPDFSAKEQELRAALSDLGFQTAWEEGHGLTVQDVIARVAAAAYETAEVARR